REALGEVGQDLAIEVRLDPGDLFVRQPLGRRAQIAELLLELLLDGLEDLLGFLGGCLGAGARGEDEREAEARAQPAERGGHRVPFDEGCRADRWRWRARISPPSAPVSPEWSSDRLTIRKTRLRPCALEPASNTE